MFQQNVTLGPGSGNFTSHTFEILVMLLGAFLLGLWLGWVLWNRYKQEADRLKLENDGLQTGLNNLTAELNALKGRFTTLDNERADLATRLQIADDENTELRARLNELTLDLTELSSENRRINTELGLETGEAAAIAALAAAVPDEETAEEDILDLTPATTGTYGEKDIIVESTNPPAVTITLEMHEPHGTVTVEKEDIREVETTDIIADADDFAPLMEDQHPDFEATGNIAATREVQMPTITDHFSDEAFESLTRNPFAPANGETATDEPVVIPVLTPLQQDDLKIVEGIGPKIEQLLFHAGIHTYSELAAAPVSRIKEILSEAGPRYAMHDPGTWSAQALLAANGEWENLKAYQEFLDAGKRPG
jgi:predicted flap endonuclease-1-like 5' DNA nuclease